MNHKQVTTLWCTVIVEELIRQGAGFFCISPGSRSTPLTLAVANNPKARFRMFPDERSSGFYALGYARATGLPAVLVCTSGTAVANYFPAVVEASADAQPMIVLSTDRPFELIDAGANQTIRQQNIFGTYSRWSLELPAPGTETPLPSLLSTVDHAVQRSFGSPAGPVHLNLPLREPLEPESPDMEEPWAAPIREWIASGKPWGRFEIARKEPSAQGIAELREILANAERPLFVAGYLDNTADGEAIDALARSLDIPLFSDLTSGIRLSRNCTPWQLAFLSDTFTEQFRPDVVIHFGGGVIGKQPASAIRKHPPLHYVLVREQPDRFNPDHNLTLSIEASPASVAAALSGSRQPRKGIDGTAFFSEAAKAIEAETCIPGKAVTEVSAARIVSSLTDGNHAIFISNSMPARNMDLFTAPVTDKPIRTTLNRGVSGIDGIISTAAGFATGLNAPTTLLIGDISFLHDLNALSLLNHAWNRLIVIVLNNHGGGIFSFLPIARETDRLDECFATPQEFSIESAAKTFGLDYAHPKTNGEFAELYKKALSGARSIIIEIEGTRQENLLLHRTLQAKIKALGTEHFS
ncbi:MAG: 2-succinyl-5-enolpyruvyl-6-hydroxy-3-cyclohexene-1-carboxylic-acid synthase [Chlorobiaceae bacterium]|nr:2-succinyl-5-enolpyruvyl-6-hydroxy-3-cyclohexene-1-carboxylic-acid synthase [Chlorobiaceae bacterium]